MCQLFIYPYLAVELILLFFNIFISISFLPVVTLRTSTVSAIFATNLVVLVTASSITSNLSPRVLPS
ncbi:MAG: hypothetical protein RR409_06070 [Clostridium sp.]